VSVYSINLPSGHAFLSSQLIILEERLFHKPATMLFKSADHFGRSFIPPTTCHHAFKGTWQ
jgi:hypothetical protein